jgi:polyisoprenyl-phosphate glycosyltransferase
MRKKRISIVVPVYNEKQIIPELARRISSTITELSQFDWEVLFVDDGSTDGSADVLNSLTHQYSWLRALYLSRNFGHQTAITAGTDYASGEAVILMDGDLQDPPEMIPEMLRVWEQGFDVITARRKRREGEGYFKRVTAFLFYRTLRLLSDTEIPVDTGDFRLMSKPVVEALKRMPERSRFLRGMVSWTGFRQTEIEYERDQRMEGKTKYTFFKMFRLAMNGILSFSHVPLQAIMALGVFFSFGSFLGILAVLYETLVLKSTVHGWSSLMTVTLFMGGVQLICLGAIGSYVGRIFDEVRARPLYFIRSIEGQEISRQDPIPFPKRETEWQNTNTVLYTNNL